MDIKEFQIPVPWGYVAVKAWGDEKNIPVLTVHGLGDNAGTFDRLIPFLPTSFYYICIDLPSHGRSSHYPPYLFITVIDNILTLKFVMDHLDRKKYIFMGHSWGGQAGMLFTQLYPEYILKLIVFDSFYLFPIALGNFKEHLTDRFKNLIKINENIMKNKQPSYTYEEALRKLVDTRLYGELFVEAAEPILKRCLIPMENGKFQFSTDPRLKVFMNPLFDMRYVIRLIKKYPITCPLLIVYASDSEAQYYYFKEFLEEIKRHKKCITKEVRGSHDVHNNSPDVVGPIVSKFLLNVKSNL